MAAFCRWHNKPLREVTEYEMEDCAEEGCNCEDCENLRTSREDDYEEELGDIYGED